jgi:hypothetical protein
MGFFIELPPDGPTLGPRYYTRSDEMPTGTTMPVPPCQACSAREGDGWHEYINGRCRFCWKIFP